MSDSGSTAAHWGRHDEQSPAVDELLNSAGVAFAELGVSKATMADIADAAGCARSTVYRYFPNRTAIRTAYLRRAAVRIATEVVADSPASDDPVATLVDRLMGAVARIRADEVIAAWFTPENIAIPLALSRGSAEIDAVAAGSRANTARSTADPAMQRWGQWLIRTAVSLLAMPMASADQEREWLQEVMAPALLAARPTTSAT